MEASVAFIAVLLRRLIADAAMRADRVVLAPPPSSFRLCIQHRLELLAVQKLVAQPAVKRFDEAVLPRTRRRHRDRLRSGGRQPADQRLADELRAVVAAKPRRRS